ncbi:topoisomerase I damage affected protein 11 [Scheffersomyces amazonensis]|uniref:topoisomerase I damage affected protein 11 n=1 Tax=Scheffersomyces amazonensis TaxID=1078765 RepID=UPI00315D545D
MTPKSTTPPPGDSHNDISINVGTPSPRKDLVLTSSRTSSVPSTKKSLGGLSRSGSVRSKGFNLNLAVSPSGSTPSTQVPTSSGLRKSCSITTNSLQQVTEDPSPFPSMSPTPNSITTELKYDLPLPSQDQLVSMNIDEQLRLLALKEMAVVEIKDAVNNLNKKLEKHDKELHGLREIIQRSLYKELTISATKNAESGDANSPASRPRQNSNPRDEAIASIKNRRRRTLSSNSHPNIAGILNSSEPGIDDGDIKSNSKIWSSLSKPLNFIQQIDTMLSNEFEKSLIPTTSATNPSNSYNPRRSEDSISSYGSSVPSPLKSKSSSMNTNPDIDQYLNTEYGAPAVKSNAEDMIHTVSSSIWTFVNDVKTNVLASLREEDYDYKGNGSTVSPPTIYNLDTGSTVSLDKSSDLDKDIGNDTTGNDTTGNDTTGNDTIISLNGRLDDDEVEV